ncbi:MAG: hypothetical protein MJ239_01870 [Bacilli bacterium]|nr:hypothetical protein [Bacilli bacterium]
MDKNKIEKLVKAWHGRLIDKERDRDEYYCRIALVDGELKRVSCSPDFVKATGGHISTEDGLFVYWTPIGQHRETVKKVMSAGEPCEVFTNRIVLARYDKNGEAIEWDFCWEDGFDGLGGSHDHLIWVMEDYVDNMPDSDYESDEEYLKSPGLLGYPNRNFGKKVSRKKIEKLVEMWGGYQIDKDKDCDKYFCTHKIVNGKNVRESRNKSINFVRATEGGISSQKGLVVYLIPCINEERIIQEALSPENGGDRFINNVLLVRYDENDDAIERDGIPAVCEGDPLESDLFRKNVLDVFCDCDLENRVI